MGEDTAKLGTCLLPRAKWRTDGYGREGRSLFLGGLYVGGVLDGWSSEKHKKTPWRGWFMSDDDGKQTGWFATIEEAKASVEEALREAMVHSV